MTTITAELLRLANEYHAPWLMDFAHRTEDELTILTKRLQALAEENTRLVKERDEWEQICANRDRTVKQQGEEWVKAKEETDRVKDQLTAAHLEIGRLAKALNRSSALSERMKYLEDGCTKGHAQVHYPELFTNIKQLNAENAQLRETLEAHHAHHQEKCLVFFSQDGKPIEIETDLGEAYSDSSLCEKTLEALTPTTTNPVQRCDCESLSGKMHRTDCKWAHKQNKNVANDLERLKDLNELQQLSYALAKWGDAHSQKGEHSVWETLDNMVERLKELERDKERLDWLGEGFLLGSDGRITAPNIETLLDEDLSDGVRLTIDSAINSKRSDSASKEAK